MDGYESDVVIVGARCAGAATATLLGGLGYRVTVVERGRIPSDTLSTHGLARGGTRTPDRRSSTCARSSSRSSNATITA